MFKEIKYKQLYQRNIFQNNNDEGQKQHLLVLQYRGHKGEQVLNSMKKQLNVVLTKNAKTRICYTGKRLGSCFETKGRMKFDHEDGLVYYVKCSGESCTNGYIGESDRQAIERVKDHNERDKSSHMLSHSEVTVNDFKVIGRNNRNNA